MSKRLAEKAEEKGQAKEDVGGQVEATPSPPCDLTSTEVQTSSPPSSQLCAACTYHSLLLHIVFTSRSPPRQKRPLLVLLIFFWYFWYYWFFFGSLILCTWWPNHLQICVHVTQITKYHPLWWLMRINSQCLVSMFNLVTQSHAFCTNFRQFWNILLHNTASTSAEWSYDGLRAYSPCVTRHCSHFQYIGLNVQSTTGTLPKCGF